MTTTELVERVDLVGCWYADSGVPAAVFQWVLTVTEEARVDLVDIGWRLTADGRQASATFSGAVDERVPLVGHVHGVALSHGALWLHCLPRVGADGSLSVGATCGGGDGWWMRAVLNIPAANDERADDDDNR